MPFDGIVTDCIARELDKTLSGGRIEKIYQPQRDELLIIVRAVNTTYKLVMSSNAANARIHITEVSPPNPASPPSFCMMLRKHLSGGRISSFVCPDFERIVEISIESVSELGDICLKKLIIEIMGKHSNIILVNETGRIIDSIRHIDSDISSAREIMPARPYSYPPSQGKTSPGTLNRQSIIKLSSISVNSDTSAEKFLLSNIKGFSPYLCRYICTIAGIDSKASLKDIEAKHKMDSFAATIDDIINIIQSARYKPYAISEQSNSEITDFHCVYVYKAKDEATVKDEVAVKDESADRDEATVVNIATVRDEVTAISEAVQRDDVAVKDESAVIAQCPMSRILDSFYTCRIQASKFIQKKAALTKIIEGQIAKSEKKLALRLDTYNETEDMNKWKHYGELISSNIYKIKKGMEKVVLTDFYTENMDEVELSLDPKLSPNQNAAKYFKMYSKAKNTRTIVEAQLEETKEELQYLESLLLALENCSNIEEIQEVKEELSGQYQQKDLQHKDLRQKGLQQNRQQQKGLQQKGLQQKDLWLKELLQKEDSPEQFKPGKYLQKEALKAQFQQSSRKQKGKFLSGKKANQKSEGNNTSQSQLPNMPFYYISSDGFTILAGKNNRQNDTLTMKTANDNDIWLHTRNIPGSHIIIRCDGLQTLPDSTMLEASMIAAWHSKAKLSSNVPVDYTTVKNVKKPPGSRPGMVTYSNFKTIIVTPDQSRIEKLKKGND